MSPGLLVEGRATPGGKAPPACFDRLARSYVWLEYLSFGPMLSRTRLHYLSEMARARRVLVLGDGDGRFLQSLLRSNDQAIFDVVDSSGAMLAELAGRANHDPRVRLHCCDALDFEPSKARMTASPVCSAEGAPYDLVVSHFFLDCFATGELEQLLSRIRPHLAPHASWVVSEFALPGSKAGSWLAAGLIRGMYLAFGLLTGLRVRELPNYAWAFRRAGLRRSRYKLRVGGLLTSELWQTQVD
ncbi:MAG TPA: class I SAM-dependent methyltransferase [Acidisarcina sp.]